jgi:multidrug efflux pump subunit AcrB
MCHEPRTNPHLIFEHWQCRLGDDQIVSDNNIFTQIAIVEFARDRELQGERPLRAVLDGARLRPILMTSLETAVNVAVFVVGIYKALGGLAQTGGQAAS